MSDRKARLAALASRAGRVKRPADAEVEDQDDPEEEQQHKSLLTEGDNSKRNTAVKFRNYTPKDNALQKDSGDGEDDEDADAEPSFKRPRTTTTSGSKVESAKKSALEEALAKAKKEVELEAAVGGSKEQIITMAPKKVNWDLKRDIQPKLDKLERRTQKAIVRLLRERLTKEAETAAAAEEENEEEGAEDLD